MDRGCGGCLYLFVCIGREGERGPELGAEGPQEAGLRGQRGRLPLHQGKGAVPLQISYLLLGHSKIFIGRPIPKYLCSVYGIIALGGPYQYAFIRPI